MAMADSSENSPNDKLKKPCFFAVRSAKPSFAALACGNHLVEFRSDHLDTERPMNYLSPWKVPWKWKFTKEEKVTTRRNPHQNTAGFDRFWGFPGYDKGDTIPSVSRGFGWKRKYGFRSGLTKKTPVEQFGLYSGGRPTPSCIELISWSGRFIPFLSSCKKMY